LHGLVLGLCAIATLASFLDARRKRQLLDNASGLGSIVALGWRDFERLVGEAFCRQGYTVEETGMGGPEGGIDLVLCRGSMRIIVQCTEWRRVKVPVNGVREMYGLLAQHRANEVRIETIGGYTPDTARFARVKSIRLINDDTLLGVIS
jgi:restriction system protein